MVKHTTPMSVSRKPVLQVPVSAMQHAWLSAMGVNVPWIVAEGAPQSAPTPSIEPEPITQAQAVSSYPSATIDQAPLAPPPEALKAALEALKKPQKRVGSQSPVPIIARQSSHTGESVKQQDLEQLQAMIRVCQACSLCEQRTHAVAGEGSAKPSVLIVGEAPGEQEDIEGRPFVGRSGQLLDNMLQAIQLDRFEQVFITNVVKCRPPANRNPREDEISACSPYLLRQIELLRPTVVLAMGRFAAHALLNTKEPLQKLRQETQAVTAGVNPTPVVVTYHPAYLLRRPTDKRLAWEDLKRVRALF
jgi:uracil-DNA glycosylase